MEAPPRRSHGLDRECLDHRSGQLLVQPCIQLGQLPDHLERTLTFAVATQRGDVGDAALLEAGDVTISRQRLGPHARFLVIDQHLIEARWQRLDEVEEFDEASMLLPGGLLALWTHTSYESSSLNSLGDSDAAEVRIAA